MAYDALRTIMLTIPEGTVNWRFHARAGFGDARQTRPRLSPEV
jgi:hypothetical protein